MPMTPVYDIQPPLELLKKGRAAEAIPMLEFISKQMPSHVSCHVLLAQAYAEEERWQEALSSWQNASFLMPNSPAIRKGFRDVLHILSRQTIKLIATAPEPDVEQEEPELDAGAFSALTGETSPEALESAVAEIENRVRGGVTTEDLLAEDLLAEDLDEPSVEEAGTDDVDAEKVDATEAVADEHEQESEALAASEEIVSEEMVVDEVVSEEMQSEDLVSEEAGDEADEEPEATPDLKPKNIFAHRVPPPLAHLAVDPESLAEDLELDELIHELESARIVPKPEHEIIAAPALESDIDDMVSETLARIYEGQKQYDEAARVYEKLATMQPDRASDFERRAHELRARAEGSGAL